MISSTNVHADGGVARWRIDDALTYTTLDMTMSDDDGGEHTVVVFTNWDQLADLCRVLMRNPMVASRILGTWEAVKAEGATQRPDGPGAMLADIYRDGGRLTDHVAFGTERRRNGR